MAKEGEIGILLFEDNDALAFGTTIFLSLDGISVTERAKTLAQGLDLARRAKDMNPKPVAAVVDRDLLSEEAGEISDGEKIVNELGVCAPEIVVFSFSTQEPDDIAYVPQKRVIRKDGSPESFKTLARKIKEAVI